MTVNQPFVASDRAGDWATAIAGGPQRVPRSYPREPPKSRARESRTSRWAEQALEAIQSLKRLER